MHAAATLIQRRVRTWPDRDQFHRRRQLLVVLQRRIRRWFRKRRAAARRIQRFMRGRWRKRRIAEMATRLQAMAKGAMCRKPFLAYQRRRFAAATKIQVSLPSQILVLTEAAVPPRRSSAAASILPPPRALRMQRRRSLSGLCLDVRAQLPQRLQHMPVGSVRRTIPLRHIIDEGVWKAVGFMGRNRLRTKHAAEKRGAGNYGLIAGPGDLAWANRTTRVPGVAKGRRGHPSGVAAIRRHAPLGRCAVGGGGGVPQRERRAHAARVHQLATGGRVHPVHLAWLPGPQTRAGAVDAAIPGPYSVLAGGDRAAGGCEYRPCERHSSVESRQGAKKGCCIMRSSDKERKGN